MTRLSINQIKDVVNDAVSQSLSEETLSTLDLTSVVDTGVALDNADAYAHFIDNLLLAINKIIFKSKVYTKRVPSIKKDSFDYGVITEVVRTGLDEAMDNQSWQLTDGATYSDTTYIQDDVQVEIFKEQTAYEVRKSIKKVQLKQAFTSEKELNKFVNMIFQKVNNSLTLQEENLTRLTASNAISIIIKNAYGSNDLDSTSTIQAVNLLYEYKQIHTSSTLTATDCLYDSDFLRFCASRIREVQRNIMNYTNIYNVNASLPTFTEKSRTWLLDKFYSLLETNLYNADNVFNTDNLKISNVETINWWQGGNQTMDFDSLSTIKIKNSNGDSVTYSGIIGFVFDDDLIGITEDETDVETNYVKSAQFYNYWFKKHARYYNSLYENAVVFLIA